MRFILYKVSGIRQSNTFGIHLAPSIDIKRISKCTWQDAEEPPGQMTNLFKPIPCKTIIKRKLNKYKHVN